jgi:hypothetical protein
MGIQVTLLQDGFPSQVSQRNIDVRELLQPGVSNNLVFLVRNPLQTTTSLTLGMVPYQSGWSMELSQDVFPDVAPGQVIPVTLTVTPPAGVDLPLDYSPILDVEGYAASQLIGGFRKIFRPPVALHTLPDPVYAESEISIDPYPLEAGRPTELCVTLRNPTPDSRDVAVQFSSASFGLGMQFSAVGDASPVHLGAASMQKVCVIWVPPLTANICVQVALDQAGYATQYSQRNIAILRGLQPGVPYDLTFAVRNPLGTTSTVTLGMIPHLDGWSYALSQDVLPNMAPGQVIPVTLTVTPPSGVELPPDDTPLLNVEGYIGSSLIGGFEAVYVPEPLLQTFLPLVLK